MKYCTLRILLLSFLAVAVMGVASTVAQDEGHGGRPLKADLSGAAEVPSPGDPDGSGEIELTVNPGQGEICYDLTLSGVDNVTGAHIHHGGPEENGDPVVSLETPSAGSASDCVQVDRELAKAILKNPSDYYVNVHNAEFPNGAVRGQLAM